MHIANNLLYKTTLKRAAALLLLCAFIFTLISGCFSEASALLSSGGQSAHAGHETAPFTSYTDIPGVTDEEIAAITQIISSNASMTFGMTHSTEAFYTSGGEPGGFSALLCGWLSDLFGIEFNLELLTWFELVDGLESGRVAFTGDLTPSDERRQTFYMTDPIAHRWLCYYRTEGSLPISEIAMQHTPRYALIKESTVTQGVYDYAINDFIPVYIEEYQQTFELMMAGEADALIAENTAQAYLDTYADVITETFFPLIDSPVSLSTQTAALKPFIDIMQKALDNGADEYLAHMYQQGYSQYSREKLYSMLSDEEKAYIRDNPVIPYAAEYDNYPSSFYNSREREWQGVCFDVLREVESLTGLTFELAHDEQTQWHEIYDMLEEGQVYFAGELIWTPERDGLFLWPDTVVMHDRPVLISKLDAENITINRVPSVTVGLPRATVHADLFHLWFPNHPSVITYDSQDETFNALLNDEVDMIMLSNNNMLYLINYLEFVDIKPNITFDYEYESTFVFHKDQALLRSIFSKTLGIIDIELITSQWTQRSYDNRAVAAEARQPWLIGAFGLSLIVLMMVVSFFVINHKRSVKQAVLRESEERMQIILDAVPLAANFWTENLENTFTNAEALRLFNVSSKQEYLEGFFSLSPEYQPDGERTRDKAHRLLKIAFDEGYCRFEWMHKTNDGEPLPCEVTLIRVSIKGGYMVAGFSRDLRTEKAAEEKISKVEKEKYSIEEAHGQLMTILEMLPVAIIIVNTENGTLLYGNKSAVKMYGARSFEADGKDRSMAEFLPPLQEDGGDSVQIVVQHMNQGTGVVQLQHKRLNGELFWTRSAYCTIMYDGIPATLNAIEDITAELEHQQRLESIAQKEREANHLKSRFLANMSHEVRTPMNAILGITEIELQKSSHPSETLHSLRQIHESGNLLLNIINDILDLSKIEAGKMEISPVKYDLPSLISDTVQLNRLRYDNKPIEFFLEVDENTPLNLFGDELRLKQILINILSNAFKYTDEGTVRLEVHAEPMSGGQEAADTAHFMSKVNLVFKISDTGQGMSADQLEQLFTDFTRFNLDLNRAIVGTGLGMSITKRLIDMMHGEIHVSSKVNEGSVFTVRIPQGRINSIVCGSEMSERLRNYRYKTPIQSRTSRTLREYMPYGSVLIVDDVESNLYVTRGMLLPYGLEIETVNSGLIAVEKIKSGNVYDIIFMDHMMPRMDGIEATNIIRESGYTGCIIALTANALVGHADMFLEHGFDGYISKPIDSRELDHVLNEFIRNKKPPEVVEAARHEQSQRLEAKSGIKHGPPDKTDIVFDTAAAMSGITQDDSQLPELKRLFMLDTENAISELMGIIDSSADGFTDAMIDSYEIVVHGMKSALATIGEHDLSDFAQRLELAAQEKDTGYILLESAAFIDALKNLLRRMEM